MEKLYGFTVHNDTPDIVKVIICWLDGAVGVETIVKPFACGEGWRASLGCPMLFEQRSDCIVKTDGDVRVELEWASGETYLFQLEGLVLYDDE